MPRDPRSPRDLARHATYDASTQMARPVATLGTELRLGALTVTVHARGDRAELGIRSAPVTVSGLAMPDDIARWGRELALLARVALPVAAGDEVELRSPALVLEPTVALALLKRFAGSEVSYALLAAPTADELSARGGVATVPLAAADVVAIGTMLEGGRT